MGDLRTTSLAQRAMESAAIVRIYESRLWRRSLVARFMLGLPFEREYQLILDAARLEAASDILDLACGSGIYSRPFARAVGGGRVVGLDLSPAMLANARRLATRERLANLFFVRGDAQELPFPAASFDLVNCCGALHLFPEPAVALAEVWRVLQPHGRFTAAVARRDAGALGLLAGRLRLFGVVSFSPHELESKLYEAGFDDVRVHHARALWLVVSARKPVGAI